ncbi:MAG: hypothetical protein ACI3Y0_00380 [Prevotella sp.]
MNLSSTRRKRLLSHTFTGKSILVSTVLYKPIRITDFEIVDSPKNKGKKLLVAQVEWNDGGRIVTSPLMTESYDLINTIRGTEDTLPHFTKIIRSKDKQYHFSELNNIEINSLKSL